MTIAADAEFDQRNTAGSSVSTVQPDLNSAIRAELEQRILDAGYASLNQYFAEFGIDKRNFYKRFKADPQIGWIYQHTSRLGVSLDTFFDAVETRRQA